MDDQMLNRAPQGRRGRAPRLRLLAATTALVATATLSGCAPSTPQASPSPPSTGSPAARPDAPEAAGDGYGGVVGRWTVTSAEDDAPGTVVQIARDVKVYRPCSSQVDAAAEYAYVIASDGRLVAQASGDGCPGDDPAAGTARTVRWLEDATRATWSDDGSLELLAADGTTTAVLTPGGTAAGPGSASDEDELSAGRADVVALWQSPTPPLLAGMEPVTQTVLASHPWYPSVRREHAGREPEIRFETTGRGTAADGCTGDGFVYVLEDDGGFRSSAYATPAAVACPWKKVRLPRDLGTARAVGTSDGGQTITLIDQDGTPIRTLHAPGH